MSRSAVRRLGGVRRLSTRPVLFDSHAKTLQKARAAISPTADEYDYIRDHIASQLVDRLQDISRTFPTALDLFCGGGHVHTALASAGFPSGITRLYQTDVHAAVVDRAIAKMSANAIAEPRDAFVLDARPLPDHLDLVVSGGALHWVNDLAATLAAVTARLKPDGVLLAAMLGGDTLQELRIALQLAEQEVSARFAPRISPTVRTRDAARLLADVGLTLPTADIDRLVVPFKDMFALMRHLKGMGESNALAAREVHCGRRVFQRAAEIYEDKFGMEGPGGVPCVPATFDIVHMIGWRPAESQPVPARRGSATVSIGDIGGLAGGSENVPAQAANETAEEDGVDAGQKR